MLGDGLGPPTCVIGTPKVGRKSYPYHLAGSVLIVGLAIQNTDSSDSTVAAILNHRPEIHTIRGRLPQTPSDENGVRQTPRRGRVWSRRGLQPTWCRHCGYSCPL